MAKKKANADGATLGDIAESLGSLLGKAEKQWRAWQGPRDAVVKAVTGVRDRAAALLSEIATASDAAADKGSKDEKKKDKKSKKAKKAKKAKGEKKSARKAGQKKRTRVKTRTVAPKAAPAPEAAPAPDGYTLAETGLGDMDRLKQAE